MASVSPPPFNAMGGLGHALMEVMRGTVVSFLSILTIINFRSLLATSCYNLYHFLSKWSVSMQQWYMHPYLSPLWWDCIDGSDEIGCSKLYQSIRVGIGIHTMEI